MSSRANKANRAKYDKDRHAARYAKYRAFVDNLKSGPCTDCGIQYPPYVMQLDHTGSDKRVDISKMMSYTVQAVLDEVAKCELVCANCHAVRTYVRRK